MELPTIALKLLNSSNQQIVSILLVNVYLPTNYDSDESTTTFEKLLLKWKDFV